MFIKMAFLNIVKHFRRASVILTAVLVTVMILVLVESFIQGITSTFLESILPTSGHVQIKSRDSKDAINPMDLKYLFDDSDKILESIQNNHIVVKEKVLSFPALLVQVISIDVEKESKNLGMMGQGLLPGTDFVQNIRQGLVQGKFLPQGEGICLSVRAAKLLDVKLGDGIMVLTQDRNNNPWYQELEITGLFDSGNDQIDSTNFVVSYKTAESLLDAEGMAREIRLILDHYQHAKETKEALKPSLEPKGLIVETWEEMFGSFITIVKLFDIISWIIRAFFMIVAASVITNSILMTMLERIREHATLRAIGLKRRQLFSLILTEGSLLGILGSIFGLVIGIPWIFLLSKIGVDIGSLTQYLGFSRLFYPVFTIESCILTFFCGIVIAFLASLYAAVVSTRLTLSQALAH